jgi:hypothetical protein
MREKTLKYCPDCGAVLTVEYDDANLWCVRCSAKVPMDELILRTIREKTITVHDLKIWPQYFQAVREGRKTFELRKWDRDYKEGDRLILREFDPLIEDFTGEAVRAIITYILFGPHAPAGMCLMSIKVVA